MGPDQHQKRQPSARFVGLLQRSQQSTAESVCTGVAKGGLGVCLFHGMVPLYHWLALQLPTGVGGGTGVGGTGVGGGGGVGGVGGLSVRHDFGR